jgi:tRNA modification GTPase
VKPAGGTDRPTIFALSSAGGRAGVAVLRVSGTASGLALERLAGRRPAPRRATTARLVDPGSGELLDRALVLWFPAPGSFTGEDVAEFHVHGSPAVIDGVLAALAGSPGCRLAEPGEFTRRAFENGRLDLSAAEGIADLIEAETAAQRRQALEQSGGGFARLTEGWAERLTCLLAHLEAAIDFPEEGLPADLVAALDTDVAALAAEITDRLADGRRGERLRDGFAVALIGPPNSGKSSLLNALAGRDAAIVSATAGTTRDVIEVHLDLGGYPVILADTAGLRDEAGDIEAEGIRRALARAESADITVLVLDGTDPDQKVRLAPLIDERTVVVWNKRDLGIVAEPGAEDRLVSARTGQGLGDLVAELGRRAAVRLAGPPAIVTRARHRAALEECVAALVRARGAGLPELIAEDLRLAVRALGRITGRVDVEDLLDVIFREFCIGK